MPKTLTKQDRKDYEKEVEKAGKRIGESREDIMLWILHFAKLDLDSLSKGDAWNLQYELSYLYHHGYSIFINSPREVIKFEEYLIRGVQGLVLRPERHH